MSRRVVVIGGGLAGITAALDCAERGAQVTLLEARGRLGGAAYSFTRGPLTVDNGQHVFLHCCSSYRALLERIGAGDLITQQRRLDIPILAADGRRGRLRRDGLPAPLHLGRSLLRYPFIGNRERLGLAFAMNRLRTVDPNDPRNDVQAFGDWLRAQRQSPRAIETIWELITRPTLNLTVDHASLAQAAQVFQVGLLQDRAAGDIGWAARPLSELHDRAAGVALARARVDVHLRSRAAAVTSTAPVTGASFQVDTAGGEQLAADAVVFAVPPEAAARLLPSAAGVDPGFSAGLGRSAIVNLHVVYDRRVLEHPFAACIGTPLQWIFDRTDSSGLRSGQYVTVSLSAADAECGMGESDLRTHYLPELAHLLPTAAEATVKDFFVTRDHSATFRAAPGARRFRPTSRTRLPHLALAGAWTDTGWPATMEGAVRSGHAAARVCLEQLAIAPSPPVRAAVLSG